MKPPRPTEGVAKHCWGKRRRIAKKTEKGLWKAMARLGLLQRAKQSAEKCSWETGVWWRGLPEICGWSPPSYGCDDWNEWPISTIAHNHLDRHIWEAYDYDAMDGAHPGRVARDDRHALQLLRKEIKSRRAQAQEKGAEG